MSIYKKIVEIGSKYIGKDKLLKYGFNLSPMYRRSTARIIRVSKDLLNVQIKLPISYKNKNYVNSIFGGSLFSSVDPIPMVQLINIIGNDYVVWDKSAEIYFRKPAKENLFAEFIFTNIEIDEIKNRIRTENEIEIVKITSLTNKEKTIVYCEVKKTIYIAKKSFYKNKKKKTTANNV
jgi:hypothetical protein|tara:strand:+ start:29 stop:562 length:534 start_codon:yes stop_codon:yes gene_type:complete